MREVLTRQVHFCVCAKVCGVLMRVHVHTHVIACTCVHVHVEAQRFTLGVFTNRSYLTNPEVLGSSEPACIGDVLSAFEVLCQVSLTFTGCWESELWVHTISLQAPLLPEPPPQSLVKWLFTVA